MPGTYEPNQPVVHIRKVSATLNVITSKQRPRKLVIQGSARERWGDGEGERLVWRSGDACGGSAQPSAVCVGLGTAQCNVGGGGGGLAQCSVCGAQCSLVRCVGVSTAQCSMLGGRLGTAVEPPVLQSSGLQPSMSHTIHCSWLSTTLRDLARFHATLPGASYSYCS